METNYYKNEEEKSFARVDADGTLFIKPFGKDEYEATGDAIKFWYEITQGSTPITAEEYTKG